MEAIKFFEVINCAFFVFTAFMAGLFISTLFEEISENRKNLKHVRWGQLLSAIGVFAGSSIVAEIMLVNYAESSFTSKEIIFYFVLGILLGFLWGQRFHS